MPIHVIGHVAGAPAHPDTLDPRPIDSPGRRSKRLPDRFRLRHALPGSQPPDRTVELRLGGRDIARFRSAVIWCRRFKVGFGVAPLQP